MAETGGSAVKGRWSVFVLVFSLSHWLLYTYVAWRLVPGNPASWLLLAVPYLLIWLVPLLVWRKRQQERGGTFLRFFQIASFLSMGWTSFIGVLTLVRDAVLALSTLAYGAGDAAALGQTFGALGGEAGAGAVLWTGTALFALGLAFTYLAPRIRRVTVPIAKMPAALSGFTIAQISDLHVGPTIRRGYVARVARLVKALAPDLIVVTGDLVDGSVQDLAPHVAPLAGLAPRERTIFVTGNHEYYWNAAAWCEHLQGLGLTVLVNQSHIFVHRGAKVQVGGVDDPAAAMVAAGRGPNVTAAAQATAGRTADLKVLLAHQPGTAAAAAAAGFHLQISGHTHGGQFWPWTWVARLFHRHFLGLSREGEMWVYVSPGTGTWGPPIRLGTLPELTLITLAAAP